MVVALLYADPSPLGHWVQVPLAATGASSRREGDAAFGAFDDGGDAGGDEAATPREGGGGSGSGLAFVPPLDMPHDDLLLPVLGLCGPDATSVELAACAAALVRRSLQLRPLDIITAPLLVTAAMAIMRKEGAAPATVADVALLLVQVRRGRAEGGEGAPL